MINSCFRKITLEAWRMARRQAKVEAERPVAISKRNTTAAKFGVRAIEVERYIWIGEVFRR